jgi:ketosteroid isomerase-like protein
MDLTIKQLIISLEKEALEAWNQGDPDAYLRLYADDYTYFDPSLERRLDGYDAIQAYYDKVRGHVNVDKYAMLNPEVQIIDSSAAVLSFNLHSHERDDFYRWNCTEVYRREDNGQWKIVHTHWSYIMPMLR